MTSPYRLFIVSHTHWDREWYQPFEEFRLRLVRLVDRLLDLMQSRSDYAYFMLDGQTIVLDDYLAVRPEREPELRALIEAGRLLIGPWYILPDEFLVGPEATVRNLLTGTAHCRRYKATMPIGHIPDSFGHISQLPQILRGFGLEVASFQRGVPDAPTEFRWDGPDGSQVLVLNLRDGYGNVAWLPREPEPFAQALRDAADRLRPYATTRNLLLMNGTDHQEPIAELPDLLKAVRGRLDGELLHSTLPAYVEAVQQELTAAQTELQCFSGEFRTPERGPILPGVLSARMWIKQRNYAVEQLLEDWAEPLQAWALALGDSKDVRRLGAHLRLAWDYLMKNHPHDSICGCSIDQVHDEMRIRFDRAEQIGSEVLRQSMEAIVAQINTAAPIGPGDSPGDPAVLLSAAPAIPIHIFNPVSWQQGGAVEVTVQVPSAWDHIELVDAHGTPLLWQTLRREQPDFAVLGIERDEVLSRLYLEHSERIAGQGIVSLAAWKGIDNRLHVNLGLGAHGQPAAPAVAAALATLQSHLDTTVAPPVVDISLSPALTLALVPPPLPPHGYTTVYVRPRRHGSTNGEGQHSTASNPTTLQNEYLRVEVAANGTLTLVELASGRRWSGLHRFVDQGDRGDEYNFDAVPGDQAITAPATSPTIRLVEKGPARQTLEIRQLYRLPRALASDRGSRSDELVDVPITTRVALAAGARRVELRTTVENHARDHRLRVHFPTNLPVTESLADGHWHVLRRPVGLPAHTESWPEQPVGYHPQRAWCAVAADGAGLMLANRGLPEYEVLPPGPGLDRSADGSTLCLTLLRCVGWLSRQDLASRKGHAGPGLPTPGAQMLGRWTFEYALIPFNGDWQKVASEAYAFNVPARALAGSLHDGPLPLSQSLISLTPASLRLSACKRSKAGDGLIVRVLNNSDRPVSGKLRLHLPWQRVWAANLAEEITTPALELSPGVAVPLDLQPWQVATFKFE